MIEIGSSDAPVIMGVSPFETPFQWWARALGLLPPREQTEDMRWGQALQEELVWWAIRALGPRMPARGTGELTARGLTKYHPERPWQRATPDAITLTLDGDVLIEAKKCVIPPDEPELHWEIQVQHQLMVTGAQRAVIVAGGGRPPRLYEVLPHPKFQAVLLAREEAMLGYVARKEPPPVVPADVAVLARVYAVPDDRVVELPPAALAWDAQRQDALRRLRQAQADQDEAEAQIKAALGSARVGRLPGGIRYTWATQQRKAFTVPARTMRVLRRAGNGEEA